MDVLARKHGNQARIKQTDRAAKQRNGTVTLRHIKGTDKEIINRAADGDERVGIRGRESKRKDVPMIADPCRIAAKRARAHGVFLPENRKSKRKRN